MIGSGSNYVANSELDDALAGVKKSNLHTPNPYKALLQRSPRSVLKGDTPLSSINKGRTPLLKNLNLDEFSTDEGGKSPSVKQNSHPFLALDSIQQYFYQCSQSRKLESPK